MTTENHIRLFERIAVPYSLFFGSARRRYRRLIEANRQSIGLPPDNARVLDVGCGPGSMAAAFSDLGYTVRGVDGSPRMAAIAAANGIPCSVADATRQLPFADDSFDVAVAAWVAHGVPAPERMAIYGEMRRVAKHSVLLYDYSPGERGFSPFSVIGILERLEGSDYIAFRRQGMTELESLFDRVEILPIDKRASMYMCR